MARAADVVLPRCTARDTLRACSATFAVVRGGGAGQKQCKAHHRTYSAVLQGPSPELADEARAAEAGAWLAERERLRAERAGLRGECRALAGRLARLQQARRRGARSRCYRAA